MTGQEKMQNLRCRLSQAGVSIQMPEWWHDNAADTDAGFEQAILLIAREAGVTLASLRCSNAEIQFQPRTKTPDQNEV